VRQIWAWETPKYNQLMEDFEMSKTIYKLCLIRGFTEAYYQLADNQKKELWDGLDKVLKPLGVEMCGPYYDCRWSNDKYATWFIMKYPDIQAAIADTHGVDKIQLSRYMISETILGIEADQESIVVP
jgi:hypothetical protein